MSYSSIEEKVHDLLTDALPDTTSVTRGYHQPDSLSSVCVRRGAATRRMHGERGRSSDWVVEVEMKVSSGLNLADWHDSVLELRAIHPDKLSVEFRPYL